MKEDELRQNAECNLCGHKIGESAFPFFYRVTVEHYVLDLQAIQRQQGMTMMMGGSALLANVMGPDEDLARKVTQGTLTVCETCSGDMDRPIAALMERALASEESDDGEDDERDES